MRIGDTAWRYRSGEFRAVEAPAFGAAVIRVRGAEVHVPGLDGDRRHRLELLLGRLVDGLRARALLDALVETSLSLCSLSTTASLSAVLERLNAFTRQMLGAEVSAVMLLDPTGTHLYWEASAGAGAETVRRLTLPVGEGIAGTVASTGQPCIVADAGRDPRVSHQVDAATGFVTRSILCVPIRVHDQILGVVEALNKHGGPFTPADQELLELIAAQAGIAIDNTRMYGELDECVRRRTRELAAANAELERTLTDLRSTQAQLVQSGKMAALGNLVAGVAHEINTPLGAMASNTDVLARGLAKLGAALGADAGRDSVAGVLTTLSELNTVNREACQRISAIVKNLRTFARLDEAELKFADLREGIESTLTLAGHLARGRIEIVREYGELPVVECRPGQINQVFMNLIVNAFQAIEGPGTVWIRARAEGDQVRIEVEDTGPGIAPEHLARIFEPGFTTKGVGVGTGLGLAISHRIVEGHGGRITAESPPGRGARFVVELPVRRRG
ncbi:MAG: GAF domain-containing protein [Candidatus Rokubacteria bacterium]|nr:GAF domain-containing protein [Candidatus Rokubacteria bacterium]